MPLPDDCFGVVDSVRRPRAVPREVLAVDDAEALARQPGEGSELVGVPLFEREGLGREEDQIRVSRSELRRGDRRLPLGTYCEDVAAAGL